MNVLLVVGLLLISQVHFSNGWGKEGHAIVAAIAQKFLTPAALKAVNAQLPPGSNLPNISSIPDYYASTPQGAWSFDLHFVDMPLNSTEFTVLPACQNGCVVTAIYNYSGQLYNRRNNITSYPLCNDQEQPNITEPCPLIFVTHFVGDVHQPLHVGYKFDKGANTFNVSFFGRCSNLHTTWDDLIIDKYSHNDTALFALELINWMDKQPHVYQFFANSTDPRQWANESFAYTRVIAYNFEPSLSPIYYAELEQYLPPPSKRDAELAIELEREMPENPFANCPGPFVGPSYYRRNIQRIKQRLTQAGVRLATLLNNIYK